MTDTEALDRIATLLGTASDWDSPADLLDGIAGLIFATDRPRPAEHAPDAYADEFLRRTGRPVVEAWDCREGGE